MYYYGYGIEKGMEQKKSNDVGAIWIKTGQYGDYLSISIEINGVKQNFSAFPNKYKEPGDKKPDYRIPAPRALSAEVKAETMQNRIDFIKEEKAKRGGVLPSQPSLDLNESDIPF
jgi:uncharacterized protein (DUF736 family)